MALKLNNNATSKLASSITAGATLITILPGEGAKFPSLGAGDWFPATIVRSSDFAIEVVKVTARSTDTFTVTRAQEGTTAIAFTAGDRIELRLTAAAIAELQTNTATAQADADAAQAAADAAQADANTAQATADNALPKAGGTMTGDIVLKGNATANLHPVTKQQMDAAVGGITTIPSGTVAAFAMNTAPAGWLKANGAAVSRATYAALFAAIGTTFGAGDGSTTFNLPDLRGEFVRGLDDGRGVDAGRGIGTGQSDQNKSHTHTGTTDSGGEHTHTTHRHNNNSGSNNSTASGGSEIAGGGTTGSAGAHTHTLTIDAAGGNEARPRNIALLYCIKF